MLKVWMLPYSIDHQLYAIHMEPGIADALEVRCMSPLMGPSAGPSALKLVECCGDPRAASHSETCIRIRAAVVINCTVG